MLNVESNKTEQFLTMDHTIISCFIVCIFCGYTAARKTSVESVTYNVNTDGSITLTCQTHISGEASEIDHIWIFNGKFLTKNTDILAKNPPRYNVKYQNNGHDRVYKLTIPNPVQKDEGSYKCRIDYKWKGTHSSLSKYVDVTIDSYLPPLNYPVCSIRPSQTLSNGTFAEFECEVGETNAQITLKLTLQSDNGSITLLGNTNVRRYLSVRRPVTLQDNKAMFICQMTSETFPTANRICSAGPLFIYGSIKPPGMSTTEASQQPQNLVTTNPLTWTSQSEASSITLTIEMHRNDSTAQSNLTSRESANQNKSDGTRRKILTLNLVGCASGAHILSLLIILGVLCRKGTHKNTSKTVNSTDRAYQADSEPEPTDIYNQTGDSHIGTMTSPNSGEHQIYLRAHHRIELIAASSNQALATVESTFFNHTLSTRL